MSEDPKLSALRLPVDLHTKIVAAALESGRSRHAEMLHRLESTFNTPDAALAKAQLDRLEAKLDAMNPERSITSMKIQLSPEDEQSLMDYLASPEGSARVLLPVYEDCFALLRRFESTGWKGTRSPTGRLSESQPELQDLPFVTGLSSLTATLRPLNYGGFYNGGFCGMPEGELPKILEPGEQVCSPEKWEQAETRSERWTVNPGDCPAEHGTRVDVLFQDGGRLYNEDVVSISWVSNKVPGLNITHWRLARPAETVVVGAWIENTGSRPLQLRQETRIEVRQRPHGHVVRYQVGQLPRSHWQSTLGNLPRISHWRLAE